MRWMGLVAVLMGAAMLPAYAQDAAMVDPGHYKVEINNDQVRVLRMTRGGHDSVPMHSHPASVVVFLTDVHEKVTGADGKVTEVSKKAGDVAFAPATTHSEQGMSDTPSEVIIVELKAPANSPVLTDDLVTVDPKHAKVIIDNDRVRVIRVHREAHESSAMHSHPEDVVIFMTDIHQTVTPKGGQPHEVNRKRGEVSINTKLSTHEETNLKDGPMESILVELK